MWQTSVEFGAVVQEQHCGTKCCFDTRFELWRTVRTLETWRLSLQLAACRREHSSPWHARSVGQHSNTLVRFCIDTTCCSDRRSVGFGRARSQPNVPIPPAYVLADATGTLSPGAGYAIASD